VVVKGLLEAIWTKSLEQNDAMEMQPGCCELFKMVATMSNFGLPWRGIS